MKVNLKELNFKKLLTDNIEKAALAVFVCGLLYFVYSAVMCQTYDKTDPDRLAQGAQAVQTHIDNTTWDQTAPYFEQNPDQAPRWAQQNEFTELARKGEAAPPMIAYATDPWWHDVRPARGKRGNPPLLPLEELTVAYGFGPFAYQGAPVEEPAVVAQADPEPARPTRRPPARGESKLEGYPGPAGYPMPARTRAGRGARAALDALKKKSAKSKAAKGSDQRPGVEGGEVAYPRPGMDEGYPGFYPGGRGGTLGARVGNGVKVEGRRWAILTGAIPMYKQQSLFFDNLGSNSATVRNEDYVQYVKAVIERAEVTGTEADNSELSWQPVPTDGLATEMEKWTENPLEPVDPSVMAPGLCLPLPPLVGRGWDTDEVVHHRIPLLKQEEFVDLAEKVAEADAKAENVEGTDAGKPKLRDGEFVLAQAQESPVAPEREEVYARERIGPGTAVVKELEYRLFRFFDFTIEPGKKYRYRVRLVVKNPNYGVPVSLVEKPELTKEEYFDTPWSNVSEMITVEKDSALLVGPVKPGPAYREGKAEVVIKQWDDRHGVTAVKSFDTMYRGQVANFDRQTVTVEDPATQQKGEEIVDFETNMLLVDFVGGDKLRYRSKVRRPAEMLFVRNDGSLEIRRELSDRRSFNNEKQWLDQLSAPAAEPADDFFNPGGFDLPGGGESPPGADILGGPPRGRGRGRSGS